MSSRFERACYRTHHITRVSPKRVMPRSGQGPLEGDWAGGLNVELCDELPEHWEAPHGPARLLERRVDGDAALQANGLGVLTTRDETSCNAGGEVIQRGRV